MAKKKESKQKKMSVRVDFTPMVDMMMLLITFFMLCTSLAKPQAMHLTMPAKDDNMTAEDKDKSKTEQTITIYLADNDKLYYYIIDKKEDFGNPEFLKETTWGKEGIREVLRNHRHAPTKVLMDAKVQLDNWFNALPKTQQEANDSIYNRAMIMIKKGHVDIVKDNQLDRQRYDKVDRDMREYTETDMVPTLAVNIKPLDDSSYDNLVTILDEMQICCIGKYVIDKINDKDLPILTENGITIQ
ncbi:MAG: biopolymer transporter ExbD [Prevotella sp.]|nr:biopolymer transporter ExbD [Prevotella sp.]